MGGNEEELCHTRLSLSGWVAVYLYSFTKFVVDELFGKAGPKCVGYAASRCYLLIRRFIFYDVLWCVSICWVVANASSEMWWDYFRHWDYFIGMYNWKVFVENRVSTKNQILYYSTTLVLRFSDNFFFNFGTYSVFYKDFSILKVPLCLGIYCIRIYCPYQHFFINMKLFLVLIYFSSLKYSSSSFYFQADKHRRCMIKNKQSRKYFNNFNLSFKVGT